jgi:hypothetical protein
MPETSLEEKPQTLSDDEIERLRSFSRTQRFGMSPIPRVSLTVMAGSTYGFLSGFHGTFKAAGLQYLAQNAHRLPTTKGGWYFYHKRKNYVVLKAALGSGFKGALKFGGGAGLYFGSEAALDYLRGDEHIDFLSTTASATTLGLAYSAIKIQGRRAKIAGVRNAFCFGLVTGLIQDGLRYLRGNNVWYVNRFIE